MTYRVNGKVVTREEFLAGAKGIDFDSLSSFQIVRDYAGYDCPVSGKWIEGRAAHKKNLERTGCRLLEKGERENYKKTREREISRSSEQAAEFLTRRIAEKLQ